MAATALLASRRGNVGDSDGRRGGTATPAQSEVIRLWPGGAPGTTEWTASEEAAEGGQGLRLVRARAPRDGGDPHKV